MDFSDVVLQEEKLTMQGKATNSYITLRRRKTETKDTLIKKNHNNEINTNKHSFISSTVRRL